MRPFFMLVELRNRIRRRAKCGNLLTVFTPAARTSGGYIQEPRAKTYALLILREYQSLDRYEGNLGSDNGN
jgi:hypothetical protein